MAGFVTGYNRTRLFAHPETRLDPAHRTKLEALLARRSSGEPLAYLTGEREFWSLPLVVAPGVLVPRPDTETLIEKIIELIPTTPDGPVLELGTGSGAIAIALAREIPGRSVVAVEQSTDALAIAAINVKRFADQRVSLVQSSWLDSINSDSAAVVVANPPYLSADDPHLPDLQFEPRTALVSGHSGLEDIEHIINDARRAGRTGCLVLLEHGSQQGLAVRRLLSDYGYTGIGTSRDLAGLERISYGYVMEHQEINKKASPDNQTFAAIDLGSNSFHMMIAEPEGNSIRKIDSLRMPTRLGAGLDENKRLLPETREIALDALSKFAERLRDVPRKHIRMVGTNTLRRAKNSESFMREAHEILNKRIEIISGREEARLIYSAVSHTFPDKSKQRLVIDIGGGSTEFVVGKGYEPQLMESVNMGCVSYSTKFLDGKNSMTAANMKKAAIEAQLEMQPLALAYKQCGWDEVIGCSGTIKAAARMLAEMGITDGTITRDGLRKLVRAIVKAGSVAALELSSISQNRTQVVAGGLAVLKAIMKTLDIEIMQASQVALREGLIFDMLGKAEHIDIQSQTLANLTHRYSIDIRQATRVEDTASKLFHHVAEPWNLEPDTDLELLVWAAKLHELGMGVAHTQYHKHGAYILENSDLMGFTLAEQTALSLLVRYHRRKIDQDAFNGLPEYERDRLLRLLGLLRLAALLHRGRHDESLDEVNVRIKEGQITVIAPQIWLDEHPLTYAELVAEAERLTHVNIKLKAEKSN